MSAVDPAGPDGLGFCGEFFVAGVEQVGQQVHAVPVQAAGQLHPRQQREPRRQRGDRLGVPGHGVVVGQRDDVEPGGGGPLDDVGG